METLSRIAVAVMLTAATGCASTGSIAGATPTFAAAPSSEAAPSSGAVLAPAVATLLTHALPADPAHEGRVLTVDFPPGAQSPSHRHHGAVFAYVLEGAVLTALDDGPTVRYGQGKSWYENPGQTHRVARNASDTQRARLLVFYLTEPGAPVAVGAK